MLSDITNADHIIVNSTFVHETMTYMGIPASKMSVIVLPVEKQFLAMAKEHLDIRNKHPASNILFAGSFSERKGLKTLIKAFNLLSNRFTLRIAGVGKSQLKKYCDDNGLSLDRINALGYLTRQELFSEMLRSRIFVFPSLCEGYAKVIQEAMACGCFIIATHNSGFSTSDGQSGIVVKPGDEVVLADSINKASSIPDIDIMCSANSAFAMNNYNSETYDITIRKVYETLASRVSK
jgi:glycosyltransferase involved in cell wall biosynthesis